MNNKFEASRVNDIFHEQDLFLPNQSKMADFSNDPLATLRSQGVQSVTIHTYNDPAKRTNKGLRFASNKKERIEIALHENAILESSPTKLCYGNSPEKLMNLRPRDREKELAGNFHFKANNFYERVTDKIILKNSSNTFANKFRFSKAIVNKRTGTLLRGLKPAPPEIEHLKQMKDMAKNKKLS